MLRDHNKEDNLTCGGLDRITIILQLIAIKLQKLTTNSIYDTSTIYGIV